MLDYMSRIGPSEKHDMNNVLEVFTNKSTEFMQEYGGSASWVLNLNKAENLEYCVCCRNDIRPREDDPGKRAEARNEAFLVGKVSGFEFVERQNGRDRYLIKFSHFAAVSVPDFRDAGRRNPVAYSNIEGCIARGLDIDGLNFEPMPAPTKIYSRTPKASEDPAGDAGRPGLSIAEAKEGLSLYFDVPVEAIQISITA